MKTRFLVYADLHVDIMHDAVARMQVILAEAKRQNAEYLIHLGDIMYPDTRFLAENDHAEERTGWFLTERDDEKHEIRRMIRESGLKQYGVLGNHDMDACDKRLACLYNDMPAPFYSFERDGFRFIVLDTNHYLENGEYVSSDHCNYAGKNVTWLGTHQLEWLKAEIMNSKEMCILLSHAPLGDEKLHAQDGCKVWEIIRDCNQDKRRVILALNGHNHIDGVVVRAGVPFMSVNSVSNIWIGHKYDCIRYSKKISEMYPHMTACAPYWDALFAVVTIDDQGIHVNGRKTDFVGPTPYELGFPPENFYHRIRSEVRNRDLPLEAMEAEGLIDYE